MLFSLSKFRHYNILKMYSMKNGFSFWDLHKQIIKWVYLKNN